MPVLRGSWSVSFLVCSVCSCTDYFGLIRIIGTGTPAGDPQEAEAIATAFFGHKKEASDAENAETPLFVGSVKTVVGHTEGTAGLAGLMKASFAVQHGVIPPNLLFENISPRVAPFYSNLKIATETTPWPTIKPGQPRRVSVNSFGKQTLTRMGMTVRSPLLISMAHEKVSVARMHMQLLRNT